MRHITVGQPNAIDRCLVQFHENSRLVHDESFDPLDHSKTTDAIERYLSKSNFGGSNKPKEIETQRIKIHKALKESAPVPIKPEAFGDFLKKHPRMREPVIDGVLRRGETCNVIAATKVGKSWMAADLAMSVATGAPWLKKYETTQGTVLLVDSELHPETLSSRLDTISRERCYSRDVLSERFFTICCRGTQDDLHSISGFLETMTIKPSLIVLDAWYRFLPSGTSENDNAGMMHLYNRLDKYAHDLDCAFLVIHHSSKGEQSGKAVTDVGSGAGSMSRAADTHIVIRPHDEDGLSVLEAATRSFPPLEPMSMFYTHPCWYPSETAPRLKERKSAHTAKQEQQRSDDVDAVVQEFKNGKPFSCREVRRVIACGETRALGIIRSGIEAERLTKYKKLKRKHARTAAMTFKVIDGNSTSGTATGTRKLDVPLSVPVAEP